MDCFVFSAGSFYGLPLSPKADDLIIAADAGYRLCRRLGITPALTIGDYDSMAESEVTGEHIRVPVEKDDTDTLLALRRGLAAGCSRFFLLGATGGSRPDHTLANLQALSFLAMQGAEGYLFDRSYAFTVIKDGSLTLRRTLPEGTVSVFAAGGPARGVTLTGLRYPLTEGCISPDFPIGVSNHFAAEEAVISVREGSLLIAWETGEAEGNCCIPSYKRFSR